MSQLGTILAESTEQMVAVVAGLVREGVCFEVNSKAHGRWEIVLTGGF